MPFEREVRVFPDLPALSRGAAEEFVARAGEAIAGSGRFAVALAGGSTPKSLYALLASEAAYRDAVDWDRVHFFFSDERHVPPDHPDSNYRMAYQALLSRVSAPPSNAHRFASELPDAGAAAEYAEYVLRRFFPIGDGEIPRFDLVLLGMGADGHTASLFPGSGALRETEKLAAAPWVESLGVRRLTLTLPVFNQAAEVLFLVSGTAKAEALKEVLEGPLLPERYPAQGVLPRHGRLRYFVDREAARLLSSSITPA